MLVRLFRTYKQEYTKGRLVTPFGDFYTIERPNLNNQRRVSCIPEGVYSVEKSTFWGGRNKGKRAFRVLNVPNRNGILIHIGNKVTDVVGCIAPGLSFSDELEKTISSTLAFNKLWQNLPHKFDLIIQEDLNNASELRYKELEKQVFDKNIRIPEKNITEHSPIRNDNKASRVPKKNGSLLFLLFAVLFKMFK